MLLHVTSQVSHSHSFLQTSQILEEADATIVARNWLDNVLEQGVRAKVDHVLKEVEDLGLPPVKNGANFQAALIHLGKKLVKNELVSLSKKVGLSKQGANILYKYQAPCSVTHRVYMFITHFDCLVSFLYFLHVYYINSFKYKKSAKWEGPGTIQAGGCGFSNHIIACIIHADIV